MSIQNEIKKKWKPRKKSAHKGDFGRVMILAGSKGLTGAAHLTGVACVKSGAGLVTLGVPEAVYPILARRSAEVMVRPFPSTRQGSFSLRAFKPVWEFLQKQDVLAIGPGLSQNKETQKFVRKIMTSDIRCPIVLDADGINAFEDHARLFKKVKPPVIVTPHPGEFRRTFGTLKMPKVPGTLGMRRRVAEAAAKKYGVMMVLKGHQTVIVSPVGEAYINKTGNPGMASGGTGDVLTGIIAALLGQKFSAWDAARFGVYLHGLAGDLAAKKTGEVSLIATDILECLPTAIQKTRRGL